MMDSPQRPPFRLHAQPMASYADAFNQGWRDPRWEVGMDAWDPNNEHCVVVGVFGDAGEMLRARWDDGDERTLPALAFTPVPDLGAHGA